MRKRDLKVLIAALAALTLVYVFAAGPFDSRREDAARTEDLFFPDLTISSVDSIGVREESRTYSLTRTGNAWLLREHETGERFHAEPGRVELAIQELARLSKRELVSVVREKQQVYEIEDDQAAHVIVKGGGTTLADVVVGKQGPDRMSSYVREPGSDDVYLSGGALALLVRQDVQTWRVKSLTSFDINDVVRIAVESGGDSVAVERADGGGWRVTEPRERAADTRTVDSALLMLENLKAMDYADDVTPAEAGLAGREGRPEAAVTVELRDGGSETIWFSKESDETYFVIRPDRYDRESVYRVSARVVGRFVLPPEEYYAAEGDSAP